MRSGSPLVMSSPSPPVQMMVGGVGISLVSSVMISRTSPRYP